VDIPVHQTPVDCTTVQYKTLLDMAHVLLSAERWKWGWGRKFDVSQSQRITPHLTVLLPYLQFRDILV